MSDKLRLFVAFDVPESLRAGLEEAVQWLREPLSEARWTKVADQHVTLKFLGWVTADRTDAIDEVCRGVAARHEPADLAMSDLGAFPSLRRARVLWAGIDDPSGLTKSIAAALDEGFSALGFESEDRPYTPHLTLARLKRPRRLEDLPQVPVSVRGTFPLEEIRLYRSHLSPQGARYEVIERFPLG